jgi:hypothetical protein
LGQATGASGVELGVGNGVSVGTGVNVDMANVGNGEGSITGAAGGATSDQLQASAATIKAKKGKVHPNFMAGFMFPPIATPKPANTRSLCLMVFRFGYIHAEYSTILPA